MLSRPLFKQAECLPRFWGGVKHVGWMEPSSIQIANGEALLTIKVFEESGGRDQSVLSQLEKGLVDVSQNDNLTFGEETLIEA